MTATPSPAPPTRQTPAARATFWDRLAIVLLGAAGFALSYDALRQTAAAIHVREPLTYAYPLVVDGFIAYGVRALLVLRDAPLPARAYAWTLFAGATAASVWANALHAVRLNQLSQPGSGLRLGDGVVGFLSTLAPLALGGAVHLYTLISRHAHAPSADESYPCGTPVGCGGPQTSPTGIRRGATPPTEPRATEDTSTRPPPASPAPLDLVPLDWSTDRPAPASREKVTGDRAASPQAATGKSAGQGSGPNSGGVPASRSVGRPAGAPVEELLAIGRQAWADSGRLSRTVVSDAVRAQGITLSSDRLTAVMERLRAEEAAAGQLTPP